jgi:hypothetical protein
MLYFCLAFRGQAITLALASGEIPASDHARSSGSRNILATA